MPWLLGLPGYQQLTCSLYLLCETFQYQWLIQSVKFEVEFILYFVFHFQQYIILLLSIDKW